MTITRWKYGPKRKIFHYRGRPRHRVVSGRSRTFTPKPPRGPPGSDEALLCAGNILYDPGFELFVGNAVGSFLKRPWETQVGSASFVLPRFDIGLSTGQRWPNGDTVDIKDIAQWSQYTEPYVLDDNNREGSVWEVVRREAPPSGQDLDFTSPRGPFLGKWMARWYGWTTSGLHPFGNSIPGGLLIQSPGLPAGYSARTTDGALIDWSFYCWKSEDGVGDEILDLCLQFYTQSGTPIFSAVKSHTLTTTKAEYTMQSNSPGGSYFIRACATFRGTGNRSMMIQVDTGTLGIDC